MSKRVPITRRYPGEWVHRTRVWRPDGSSVQVEGPLNPDVGDFILQLHMHGDHVDGGIVAELRSLADRIRQSVERTGKVRDVMES